MWVRSRRMAEYVCYARTDDAADGIVPLPPVLSIVSAEGGLVVSTMRLLRTEGGFGLPAWTGWGYRRTPSEPNLVARALFLSSTLHLRGTGDPPVSLEEEFMGGSRIHGRVTHATSKGLRGELCLRPVRQDAIQLRLDAVRVIGGQIQRDRADRSRYSCPSPT